MQTEQATLPHLKLKEGSLVEIVLIANAEIGPCANGLSGNRRYSAPNSPKKTPGGICAGYVRSVDEDYITLTSGKGVTCDDSQPYVWIDNDAIYRITLLLDRR
jgi:hypothetical protein